MKFLKNSLPYFLVPILSVAIFCVLFQTWNVDFTLPIFGYQSDSLIYIFLTKTIIETGWFLSNDAVGLPHVKEIFSIYDFPLEADMFFILILKFFTYFSHNTFLVIGCFFIASFAMISAASFIVLRSFKISIFTAAGISILYAFMPYHFIRGTWHVFLTNYMAAPLAVMVGLWISSDKIHVFFGLNKKGQYSLSANKFFFIAAGVSAFVAANDIYYAYYSCIIFIFSWLLYAFKKGTFMGKGGASPLILCTITFICLAYLYLPTLFYQLDHGANSSVGGRLYVQSEGYALRIINLLLPVPNHYIEYLANLRNDFNLKIEYNAERDSASLGLLAVVGFLFLILWVVGKNFTQENSLIQKTIQKYSFSKSEQNLISDLAGLNLLAVLFATVGGLVMLIAVTLPMIRSHTRFSIFIAFISLFLIAIIFDKIIERKLFGKKLFAQIAVGVVMVLALFDLVGRVSPESIQSKESLKTYFIDRDFVAQIESSMPPKSMIFILPISTFPELDDYQTIIGYVQSKQLRWSYPVITGRDSDLWQKQAVSRDFKYFISEIRKAGFAGVYVDKYHYTVKYSAEKLESVEKDLKAISKKPVLSSRDGRLEFFEI